jgi:membrane associated rhomboid family serine protease
MFFIPLFDDNPSRRTPWVAWMIIAACVIVFMWQQSLPPQAERLAFFQYGFIPANASGAAPLPPEIAILPAWATMISAMFLHGGWMHIGGNMLYLWIFGDNVEDSMGPWRFVVFYLLCGAAAALAQYMIGPASRVPMVGASGGIAGILGAYLILHPRAAIRTFLLILIFIRFINLPAWVVLGIWIGGQFVAVPNALGGDDGGVAYFAHIGGFLAGMVLIPFFKRSDVPLFGANDSPPDHQPGRPIPFSEIRKEARYRYGRRTNDPLRSRVVVRDAGSGDDGGDTEDSASPWQAGSGEETRDHPGAGRRGGSVPRFKRRRD